MAALGGLARQKWLESQQRKSERAAAAAAQASAAATVAATLGAYSDSESEGTAGELAGEPSVDAGSVVLGAMTGYDSDSEEQGGGEVRGYNESSVADDHSNQRVVKEATAENVESVRERGGEEAERRERGPFWLVAGRIDRRHMNEEFGQPHTKKQKVPAAQDALKAALPAVEDLLALQPKEPTKEEKREDLNAEQARRIEELFFWYYSAPLQLFSSTNQILMMECYLPKIPHSCYRENDFFVVAV